MVKKHGLEDLKEVTKEIFNDLALSLMREKLTTTILKKAIRHIDKRLKKTIDAKDRVIIDTKMIIGINKHLEKQGDNPELWQAILNWKKDKTEFGHKYLLETTSMKMESASAIKNHYRKLERELKVAGIFTPSAKRRQRIDLVKKEYY